jgi:hypothetical protein
VSCKKFFLSLTKIIIKMGIVKFVRDNSGVIADIIFDVAKLLVEEAPVLRRVPGSRRVALRIIDRVEEWWAGSTTAPNVVVQSIEAVSSGSSLSEEEQKERMSLAASELHEASEAGAVILNLDMRTFVTRCVLGIYEDTPELGRLSLNENLLRGFYQTQKNIHTSRQPLIHAINFLALCQAHTWVEAITINLGTKKGTLRDRDLDQWRLEILESWAMLVSQYPGDWNKIFLDLVSTRSTIDSRAVKAHQLIDAAINGLGIPTFNSSDHRGRAAIAWDRISEVTNELPTSRNEQADYISSLKGLQLLLPIPSAEMGDDFLRRESFQFYINNVSII